MATPKVLAIVLAGGEGKRLMPLTADRAKPAVPYGGVYRLVDFALSNLVNARYLRIVVLTQYKSHSLDRHISQAWRMSTLLGNYIAPVPAQQRVGKRWYAGSADAIFQSLNLVHDERPDHVVVVGADNIYRMDFGQMLGQHIQTGAAATVAAIRQPIKLANQFGVIDVPAGRPAPHPAFLRSPRIPTGSGLPRRDSRLDGQLHLRHRRADRRGRPRQRARGLGPRHGRRHHPRLRRAR
jgi:glucose-1-phosphate adenylyltransferase